MGLGSIRLGWMVATTAALALCGCKSTGREGAAPRADAGPVAARVDCDGLLLEDDIERICEAPILRRTAAWGEGWSPAPACDRKFFTERGALLGFRLHQFPDPAAALADFQRGEARACGLQGAVRLARVIAARLRGR